MGFWRYLTGGRFYIKKERCGRLLHSNRLNLSLGLGEKTCTAGFLNGLGLGGYMQGFVIVIPTGWIYVELSCLHW